MGVGNVAGSGGNGLAKAFTGRPGGGKMSAGVSGRGAGTLVLKEIPSCACLLNADCKAKWFGFFFFFGGGAARDRTQDLTHAT